MLPYGTDRLRVTEDGRIFLASRRSKGWVARVPRTLTKAEFPGTAVQWEDALYEVVSVEPLPAGVRYELAPWADHHTIRVIEAYDTESEQKRAADVRDARVYEKLRHTINSLAILSGHAPAAVQKRWHHQIGTWRTGLTIVSALPQFGCLILCLLLFVRDLVDKIPIPMPSWAFLLLSLFGLESIGRLIFVGTQSRPTGSILGWIAYSIWWTVSPGRARLPPPIAIEKGLKASAGEVPSEIALRDAYHVREPFLAFLSSEEQVSLKNRYGFDPIRHGRRSAITLMIFSALGVISALAAASSSVRGWSVLWSFGLAVYLLVEQIHRLNTFHAGRPAGSVLGYFIRPWANCILNPPPVAEAPADGLLVSESAAEESHSS